MLDAGCCAGGAVAEVGAGGAPAAGVGAVSGDVVAADVGAASFGVVVAAEGVGVVSGVVA